MSDEMMVQSRPSVLPYALGGAALGAAGGAALTKWTNFNIATKYADNPGQAIDYAMAEMVEQTNAKDRFVHQMVEKDKAADSPWKILEEQATKVKEANDELGKIMQESGCADRITDYQNRLDAIKREQDNVLVDLLSGNKKLGEGEGAKTFIDTLIESSADDDKKAVDEALARFKEASKDKTFKVGEKEGVKLADIVDAELKNLQEFKAFAMTDNSIKNRVMESPQYKEVAEKAKTEVDALRTLITSKKSDFNFENYGKAYEKWKAAYEEAGNKLTDDVVAKCKTPRMGLTMLAGAAGLALIGAFIGKFANKNKDK